MNEQGFSAFLNVGIGLCGVFVLFNLWRSRTRGASALALAVSFAAMGGLLYALRESMSQVVIVVLAVLVTGGLAVDGLLRAKGREDRP